MIFSENRHPLFGIMLSPLPVRSRHASQFSTFRRRTRLNSCALVLKIPRISMQEWDDADCACVAVARSAAADPGRSFEVIMAAVALQKEKIFEQQAPPPSRGEVLARYRDLREISKRHHSSALDFLSGDAVLHRARRLGLAAGKTFILDSMDELTLAFDLAIHTAPAGRSRAIDRYARSAQLAEGSDEALVLEAMCNARFAVVSVQRRHQSAGLIVTDLFRKIELWLVDEGLEISLPVGAALATRYFAPDRFVMTAGVVIPVDVVLLTSAIESAPQRLRKPRAEAIEDRRFAEAVYRAAIADGIMEGLAYRDPAGTGEAA